MILTRLTEKHQTTIPLAVRKLLGLTKGDSVVFEIEDDNRVTLRKASQLDFEYLKAVQETLCEWTSENDEEAYKTL